jgi:hypothetical protein
VLEVVARLLRARDPGQCLAGPGRLERHRQALETAQRSLQQLGRAPPLAGPRLGEALGPIARRGEERHAVGNAAGGRDELPNALPVLLGHQCLHERERGVGIVGTGEHRLGHTTSGVDLTNRDRVPGEDPIAGVRSGGVVPDEGGQTAGPFQVADLRERERAERRAAAG